MSQVSSDSGAIIAAVQADLVIISTIYSMAALVAYEYILTINQEVSMIWRRKWTLVTWIFLANRYVLIALTIWGISPYTAQRRVICFPVIILGDVLRSAQNVVFAGFSALRVFAIFDRNLPMTLLVLGLNLVPVATNLHTAIISVVVFTVDPIFGTLCSAISPSSARTNFERKLALGTRLTVITADILVLALTGHKTFSHRMAAIRAGVRTPLSAMLLRDGTVYFVVLLVINIADVIVNNVPSLQNVSPVPNLIQGLTSILISRFLLNLRQLGEPENETQSRFNSRFSIPGFRVPTLETVVGNMGADLGRGPAEEIDDEAEEVDMDGTDAQNVVLDGIAEDTSGGPVVESVYGIQEVPLRTA